MISYTPPKELIKEDAEERQAMRAGRAFQKSAKGISGAIMKHRKPYGVGKLIKPRVIKKSTSGTALGKLVRPTPPKPKDNLPTFSKFGIAKEQARDKLKIAKTKLGGAKDWVKDNPRKAIGATVAAGAIGYAANKLRQRRKQRQQSGSRNSNLEAHRRKITT